MMVTTIGSFFHHRDSHSMCVAYRWRKLSAFMNSKPDSTSEIRASFQTYGGTNVERKHTQKKNTISTSAALSIYCKLIFAHRKLARTRVSYKRRKNKTQRRGRSNVDDEGCSQWILNACQKGCWMPGVAGALGWVFFCFFLCVFYLRWIGKDVCRLHSANPICAVSLIAAGF